jgi:Domain of unknown function (DUF4384)
MTTRNGILLAATLGIFNPWMLSAQQQLTARDVFWSASDLITVTPNPAAHKHTESPPRPHPQSTTGGTEVSGTPGESTPVRPQRKNIQVAKVVMENGYGAAPHLVRAAESRLGLRCSVMLRGGDGQYNEVTPGSVFHSGDHIRLSFLANEPGYFYVIQQGSTGAWLPIFPPKNSAKDANRMIAGQLQIVPGGTQAFAFDQNPGDEKLYVLLSRTPIADIDRAVEKLRSNQSAAPGPQVGGGQVMEAENRIPDAFVQQLASRDLTLVDEQKVNEPAAGNVDGEKAIYVVSKGSGPEADSQVLLSVDLRHE